MKKLMKKQELIRAKKFHYDNTVRKFFCVWIERFIDRIREQNELTTIPQEETKEE